MTRYPPDTLRTLVRQISQAAGVPDEAASILARALVDADLHGSSTHGVSRLRIYLQRIEAGYIDASAELHVDRHRRPGVLAVDARNGLGQVQAIRTLDRLVPLARELGLAAAVIRRSQHFGALSHYCNRAAEQNMILLASTSCEPAVSPAGGRDAFFGTNPIAASFPTSRGWPVKIDLATSTVARGNIIAANREGRPIPEGWALDPDGEPTTDAALALAGTVLTMAGHKGYALALLVEILSSVLSGAAIGPDIGSMYRDSDRPQDVGHFFCLLDIAAFMDVGAFTARIEQMIDRIKTSRRRPGVDEILVPGERSARTAEANRRNGIPLAAATVHELNELSERFDVALRLHIAERSLAGTSNP